MTLRKLPSFEPRGNYKKDDFNRLVREVERLSQLSVQHPLELVNAPGGPAIRMLPFPLDIVRCTGTGTGMVVEWDDEGETWVDSTECRLTGANDEGLEEDKLYLALKYEANHYKTVCCGATCPDGVDDCDECDCAAETFEFDISESSADTLNGHYTVEHVAGCVWSGTNGTADAVLQFDEIVGLGNCWHIVVSDGSDTLTYAIDCTCASSSSPPSSCPTSVCLTVSGVADQGCDECANANGDFLLLGSCDDNGIGTYTKDVALCFGTVTFQLVVDWNDTFTGGDCDLSIIDGDTSTFFGNGTFPLVLTPDSVTAGSCNWFGTYTVKLAAACSPSTGCSCTPPQTVYARIIDWTTGDCSACHDTPAITMTFSGGVWTGSGTWCGQSVTLGLFCQNDAWLLGTNHSGGPVAPYDDIQCSPFSGVWLLGVGACTAFVQILES